MIWDCRGKCGIQYIALKGRLGSQSESEYIILISLPSLSSSFSSLSNNNLTSYHQPLTFLNLFNSPHKTQPPLTHLTLSSQVIEETTHVGRRRSSSVSPSQLYHRYRGRSSQYLRYISGRFSGPSSKLARSLRGWSKLTHAVTVVKLPTYQT